ncbi:MAG: dihydroorotase [Flavobacteriaceae bacterium]|nr:dihydroorotase [Flavobacteriaceae bacterium]
MSILIKSAKIIDAKSDFNGKTQDILIEKGVITKINSSIKSDDAKIINLKNLHVSPGWIDSSVCFGEPGYEDRETIENGTVTAASSGYTDVILNPYTKPILDSRADISFIKNKSLGNIVDIHPLGALTRQSKSNELADLKEMFEAGCVGFYDFKKPITNPNILKTALQYVQHFNGLILSFPLELSISKNAQMHEGTVSTTYGLKGFSEISEEIAIFRDIKLLEYTGGKLHFPTISSLNSLNIIKEAKSKGLNVTCGVSINNLFFNDEKLKDFDTRFKVNPPIRDEKSRKGLIKGVETRIIDCVTSDHIPVDIDNKKTDFENSDFGAIGLESSFGALNSLLGLNKTIEILNSSYEIFNLSRPTIDIGNEAKISMFDPTEKYIFSKKNIYSSSKNSSFLNTEITGISKGIISNSNVHIVE